MINNSLTNSKDELSTVERNHVKFYICGPTVYNSAHLGHARAYLTFDIIRGILEDYFSLDVSYVMNITDIDDKIILRGRQAHLIETWMQQHVVLDASVIVDLTATVHLAKEKLIKKMEEFATPKDEEERNMRALYEKQLQAEESILVDLKMDAAVDPTTALNNLFSKFSTLRDNLG